MLAQVDSVVMLSSAADQGNWALVIDAIAAVAALIATCTGIYVGKRSIGLVNKDLDLQRDLQRRSLLTDELRRALYYVFEVYRASLAFVSDWRAARAYLYNRPEQISAEFLTGHDAEIIREFQRRWQEFERQITATMFLVEKVESTTSPLYKQMNQLFETMVRLHKFAHVQKDLVASAEDFRILPDTECALAVAKKTGTMIASRIGQLHPDLGMSNHGSPGGIAA